MNDEELYKNAEKYLETTGHAVQEVINPQIEGFKKGYKDFFRELATASGVIVGAVTVLLSSNIPKIDWLTILGFILLVGVVILTFFFFKAGITDSVPFIEYLNELSHELTVFSYNTVRFSRKEITAIEFQEIEEDFKNKYDEWRNDQRGIRLNLKQDKSLSKISKWYSEINIIFLIFVVGITCVALSIFLPKLNNKEIPLDSGEKIYIKNSLNIKL